MTIKVTGKNLEVGENLREYVSGRVELALSKYSGRFLSAHFSVEKAGDGFTTHCDLHLASGMDMRATGHGTDAYASVDSAVDRVEKQFRRYKRRLKGHGQGMVQTFRAHGTGIDYTIDAKTDPSDHVEDEAGGAPSIIAEKPAFIQAMSVSDAVMQLDLANLPFVVFRNAAHDGVNFVYRRPDGHIGWIDPSVSAMVP